MFQRRCCFPVLSAGVALLALVALPPLSAPLPAQTPEASGPPADTLPSEASLEPAGGEPDSVPGTDARAEVPRWSVDLWMGSASPKGDLNKLNVGGVMGWVSVGRRWTSRVRIRADAGFMRLQRGGLGRRFEEGSRGPQTDLWPLLVGPEVELTPPEDGPWRVTVAVSGGATRQDAGEPRGVPLRGNRSPVQAWVGTGAIDASVGYDVARTVRLFIRGGAFAMIGDVSDPESSFLGKETVHYHAAGLRVQF